MTDVTFDGANKRVTIGYDGPVTAITARDIYSRWKEWVMLGNAQYLPAFAESVGGNPLSDVQSLSGYFFLRNDLGWRIKPTDNQTYQIMVAGDLYPSDPDTAATPWLFPSTGGDVLMTFDRSAASSIVLGAGGARGTVPSAAEIAAAVWSRPLAAHVTAGTMGKRQNDVKPTAWGL